LIAKNANYLKEIRGIRIRIEEVTMYTKILVPLDGSPFSEAVLPHVKALVQATGAEVILLRVLPTPIYNLVFASDTPMPRRANPEYDSRTLAETYLDHLAFDHFPGNADVRLEVSGGSTADVILEFAAGQDVDLIAMTTHGRSGISRLMLGSVAEQVVQRSHLTVLLVRPE